MGVNCLECGVSKDSLKKEIIQEIMPLLCSCKGVGVKGTRCQRAPGEGSSQPLDLSQLVPCDGVPPDYATSAGVLDRDIKVLQQQIGHNLASRESSKSEFMAETIKLLSIILLADDFEEVKTNDVGDEELAKAINKLRSFGLNGNQNHRKDEKPLTVFDSHPTSPTSEKIKLLEKQLAETKANCDEAKESFEKDLVVMRERTKLVETATADLSSTVRGIDVDLDSVFLYGDKHEAWSRRSILLLEGLLEKRGEDTNHIAIKLFRAMGINVSLADICRSHRNGPHLKGRHRPIYVKFVRHDIRDAVYYARDNLRQIRNYRYVFINENLTKYRSRLFREARKEKAWQSWTYDGAIYCCRRGEDSKASRLWKIVKISDFKKVFGRHPFKKTAS